ncbi:MAG: LCP family protein [Actinomycetota bacterium]|nr:LCP family protein [Actinomycetota bacterium]
MSERKPTAVADPEGTEPPNSADEFVIASQESLWVWIRTPVLFFAGVLCVLISVTSVWAINVIRAVESGQVSKRVPSIDPWDGVEPRNVLVLGNDSRAGLSEEQQAAFGTEESVGGQRTDTIILLSIDPAREQAVVVHFPRDLRVAIPGHGTDKINAAYEYGGADLVVRTVQAFAGLRVHNYMEIDLAGFQKVVNTLNGVKICVDRAMHDPLAGLDIPSAGCYLMDGEEALAFVRARHVEGDLIPDFSRIRRQQQFMRAMMSRVMSLGTLLDEQVIRDVVSAVTTDDTLSATDLIELGRKLQALAQEDPTGAESLDLRVIPGTTQTIGDVSYVLAEQPETRDLFEALRHGEPLRRLGQDLALTDPTPAIIKVRVFTVTGADPSDATTVLKRGGFVVLPGETAGSSLGDSEIVFKAGARSRARVVSGFFPGLPVREVPSNLLDDAEVGVVVGDDFSTLLTEPE